MKIQGGARQNPAKPWGRKLSRRRTPDRRTARFQLLEPRHVLAAPTLAVIPDVTVRAGAPLNIALDGLDADGDALSFSATSNNTSLVATQVPTNNKSLKLSVANFGDMTFQLFEDLAPRTTKRISDLATSGFYNGVIFHRVIKDFVIQGGDPTGTGSGGSGVNFDDEFNPLLRHTSSGILSMAKAGDDTNDSQFFVTARDTRNLDFNHSVFGFLTSGESVRSAIANVPTNANDKPVNPVTIQSASIFVDKENGVLRLVAPRTAIGQTTVTVIVNDGNGGTAQRTFNVNVVPDSGNNATPFLGSVSNVTFTAGGKVEFSLTATDLENDPIKFVGNSANPAVAIQFTPEVLVPSNGLATTKVTISASGGFVGSVPLSIVAHTFGTTPNASNSDLQRITATVSPPNPPTLRLVTDTGFSDSDGLTNRNNSAGNGASILVGGIIPGAVVTLLEGNAPIGSATIDGDNGVIALNSGFVLSDGLHKIRAVQNFAGAGGTPSSPIDVFVDSQAPQITSSPLLTIAAGSDYAYNVASNEEGQTGFAYRLDEFPTGMSIIASSGEIKWLPLASQTGTHNVKVIATDGAGNTTTQAFSVQVTNASPILDDLADRTLSEIDLLDFIVPASDPNANGDRLKFELGPNSATGATIDPDTGRFQWTPTEEQGPGNFTIPVKVTDLAGAAVTKNLVVHVLERNSAPVIAAISDFKIPLGQSIDFKATATDADVPVTPFTFQLGGQVPTGATINPLTGDFHWTPNQSQAQQDFVITVQAVDSSGEIGARNFKVSVKRGPVFDAVAAKTVAEGSLLNVSTHAASPGTVHYSLQSPPAGATVDTNTGLFSWTPGESQGPGKFNVSVVATDNDGFTDTATFEVTVNEVNVPPQIAPISKKTVNANQNLQFQIQSTDPDLPGNALTFSLESDSPAGASIDSKTGIFSFKAPGTPSNSDLLVTVRVTDAGGLFATQSFVIQSTQVGFALFGINRVNLLLPTTVNPTVATNGKAGDAFFEQISAAAGIDSKINLPPEITAFSRIGPETGIPEIAPNPSGAAGAGNSNQPNDGNSGAGRVTTMRPPAGLFDDIRLDSLAPGWLRDWMPGFANPNQSGSGEGSNSGQDVDDDWKAFGDGELPGGDKQSSLLEPKQNVASEKSAERTESELTVQPSPAIESEVALATVISEVAEEDSLEFDLPEVESELPPVATPVRVLPSLANTPIAALLAMVVIQGVQSSRSNPSDPRSIKVSRRRSTTE